MKSGIIVVEQTLAWCNEKRAEQGLEALAELPRGIPDDPETCPCGQATGLSVDHQTYGPSLDRRFDHPLPEAVAAFVKAFDDEELPALIDEKWWRENREESW